LKVFAMLISQTRGLDEEGDSNVVRLGLDLPAAAASALEDIKRKFANQRQWREFVSAVQCSVNYPAAINSVRSGTKWFSDGLAQASSCLKRTLLLARDR
jgi:hypothetical protein